MESLKPAQVSPCQYWKVPPTNHVYYATLLKKKNQDQLRMSVEHVSKTQISHLKIKWPPSFVVSKDIPSCQPQRIDQVKNKDEGQKLKEDHLHRREDEFHQQCLPNVQCRTPQTN